MVGELHFPSVAVRIASVTDAIRSFALQMKRGASRRIAGVTPASLIPDTTMASWEHRDFRRLKGTNHVRISSLLFHDRCLSLCSGTLQWAGVRADAGIPGDPRC